MKFTTRKEFSGCSEVAVRMAKDGFMFQMFGNMDSQYGIHSFTVSALPRKSDLYKHTDKRSAYAGFTSKSSIRFFREALEIFQELFPGTKVNCFPSDKRRLDCYVRMLNKLGAEILDNCNLGSEEEPEYYLEFRL